jgi:hypothetical protein
MFLHFANSVQFISKSMKFCNLEVSLTRFVRIPSVTDYSLVRVCLYMTRGHKIKLCICTQCVVFIILSLDLIMKWA